MFDKSAAVAELSRFSFREPWWLRGRHLQTLWGPLFRRQRAPVAVPQMWQTPDGDQLRVWIREGRPDAPWVLLLHGLEGCSLSSYIVGLRRDFDRMGWSVAVLDFRSCGGQMNRARRLYHSGETEDIDFVVRRLKELSPACRLYVAGFSLGGNASAKWLGESGSAAADLVAAAAVVCPPFDLTVAGPALDDALFGLYTRRFLRSLIPKAVEKESQFPGCLDVEAVRRSRSFRDFDTHGTAALHGFRDAEDYWQRVGCGQFLADIRVPTLLLAAANDPFNPASTLPVEVAGRSPYLVPMFANRGGHVGFVYGVPWRTRHWAEEQIVRFFCHLE